MADDQPTGSAPPGSFAETVLFMAVLVGLAGIAVALVSVSAPDGVKFVLAAILAMLTAVCFGLFVIVRR